MFSERLKLARKREGLSLRDLASRIDGVVSAQAIGKYERGMSYLLSPSDALLLIKQCLPFLAGTSFSHPVYLHR